MADQSRQDTEFAEEIADIFTEAQRFGRASAWRDGLQDYHAGSFGIDVKKITSEKQSPLEVMASVILNAVSAHERREEQKDHWYRRRPR